MTELKEPAALSEGLVVRGLTVRYTHGKGPAVRDFSTEIRGGDAVAIVGEFGSGKSTLTLAITRLLPPATEVTADDMRFDGAKLAELKGQALRVLRARRIGTVFQSPRASWNPTRKIGVQLIDGLKAAGKWPAGRAQLLHYMGRVGIDRPASILDLYPHHLSGGMLQRIMIAGVLANGPSLLLADEPTSALDTTVQAELLELLAELRREARLSLLLVSHDFGVVSRVAEKTIVLYGGETVETGPTRAMYQVPNHPYTLGLLAAILRLDGPRKVRVPSMAPGSYGTSGCIFAPRCPLAVERCVSERPALRVVGATNVACHRAEDARQAIGWAP